MSQRCECGYCYEECYCERKPEKPNRTMLKCGCPSSLTLPDATAAGTAFTVATISLDSGKFCNPCLKFDFSSNIITTASVLTLNFQIFKQCKNQLTPTPVGSIWTFSRLVAATDGNTFSFTVCDCDSCNDDCCTYTVVATVVGVATAGVTSINNAAVSALVVDNNCSC